MEKEFQFKDFLKKYLLWILIIPILFISILAIVVKWGTIHINTSELIIDLDSPIKLGEYLYYYISIVGIEVTGLLSYSIWKTSIQSNKLSEDIIEKEYGRDTERIRESALIVYYDLLSNIGILKLLYSTRILKSKADEINNVNISSDWVKNLANLRDILTRKELEKIFNLYNSFLMLNELTSNNKKDELEILIRKLSEMIFIPVLLDYLWMDYNGLTEAILNKNYYPILRKIELASINRTNNNCENDEETTIIKQNNKSIKYEGIFIDGILELGIDNWYLANGELLYSLEYENGKIVRGKYFNKFREECEVIFDCEFYNERQTNGYTTLFHDPNRISYQGLITEGQPDGIGKSYSKNNSVTPLFSGVWKDNVMVKGEYINKSSNNIIYFKGQYRNNSPYSGKIECSYLFNFKGAYGFNGIINEGKILKGSGYKVFNEIIDEEYRKENPWYDMQDDDHEREDDYEEYEDIPDEVQQEFCENHERNEIQMEFDYLKNKYKHVVELIKADWNNGECELYSDDLLNKKHFAYNQSKR